MVVTQIPVPLTPEERGRFIAALRSDEAFRNDVRKEVLTEQLLEVPQHISGIELRLTEIDARIAKIELRLTEMDARIAKIELRLTEMDARITEMDARITEMDARLTARIDELTVRMDELAKQIADLVKQMAYHAARTDKVIGEFKEMRFRLDVDDYLYELVDNAKVMKRRDIDRLLAKASPDLRNRAREVLFRSDAVVSGKLPGKSNQVTAVVEISSIVGSSDIERARNGASLLEELGVRSFAVVAGEEVTEEGDLLIRDGHATFVSMA